MAWALALTSGGIAETGAVANGAGQFSLGGLRVANHFVAYIDPTGSHATRFFPNSPNVPDATTVAVTAGGNTIASGPLPTEATVGTGTALAGTITEQGTGTPLAGVFVLALNAADYTVGRGGVTNASGQYTLDATAGPYVLAFVDATGRHNGEWHDNQPLTNLSGATNVSAPTLTNATLDRNSGSLSGTVRDDPSNTPIAGAWVVAIGPTGINGGAVTAANGTYTITGLPPGTYRATFVDPNGGRAQEFFDEAAGFGTATPFNISAGTNLSGVDGNLSLP